MWLRNPNCCRCNCNDKITKRTINMISAGISGSLFAAGWWCFIDAVSVHPAEYYDHGWFVLPGIGSSLAFVVVNVLAKLPSMQMNAIYVSRTSIWCLRFLLFIGFFLSFSMIFTAVLMFSLHWSIKMPHPAAPWSYAFTIPQTIFICIATFTFYFGIDVDTMF